MWEAYHALINDKKILSVKEVAREIEEGDGLLTEWARNNKPTFLEPSDVEANFISTIFTVQNFQQSLERKKRLKGGAFADPFVVAKAKVLNFTVITEEKLKPNAAKIPNICKYFNVKCTNLEGFMEQEGWKF